MSPKTESLRKILTVVAELGLLVAAGVLAIALVGNDGSDRAEESARSPAVAHGPGASR